MAAEPPSARGRAKSPTSVHHAPSSFGRQGWAALLLMAVLLLAACAAPAPPLDPSFDLAAYRPFLTPGPLLPFRATGSARIQYGGEVESGQFILTAGANHTFRFQLLTPLTGTLAVELRFDERRLLAINHNEGSYFLAENTEENRRRLFSLDITAPEFLMLLTGRVPRAAFEAGGGKEDEAGGRVMERGGVRYRFLPGEGGLPAGWSKERRDESRPGAPYRVEYRVTYREFLEVGPGPGKGGGAPLRFPRKIRVRSAFGDGAPLLVIGLREFHPGARSPRPLTFDLPQGKNWRFEPPPLPP